MVAPARSGIETALLADASLPAAAIAIPSAPVDLPDITGDNPPDKVDVTATDNTDANNPGVASASDKLGAELQGEAVPVEVGRQGGAPADASTLTPPSTPTPAPAPVPQKSAALEPASPDTPPAITAPSLAEPFGLAAEPVNFGPVLKKWSKLETGIRADNEILARCRLSDEDCPAAAQNFLAIIEQGRAQTGRTRIGVINRAINLAIKPMSDMVQWGVPDRWSPPLETFTTGRGDCEDYAIAKYVALTAAGIPAADVKLVIVRNLAANEDHAVTAVRLDGDWVMLDNRWLTLVADSEMPRTIPLFVLDGGGVREFSSPTLIGARRASTPASF
jgi:predicted transglutaminase-like cysteine proteinase